MGGLRAVSVSTLDDRVDTIELEVARQRAEPEVGGVGEVLIHGELRRERLGQLTHVRRVGVKTAARGLAARRVTITGGPQSKRGAFRALALQLLLIKQPSAHVRLVVRHLAVTAVTAVQPTAVTSKGPAFDRRYVTKRWCHEGSRCAAGGR